MAVKPERIVHTGQTHGKEKNMAKFCPIIGKRVVYMVCEDCELTKDQCHEMKKIQEKETEKMREKERGAYYVLDS